MSTLNRRLRLLEQRRPVSVAPCPEHPPTGMPPGTDWRPGFMNSLRAFSPDDEDRAAYNRELDEIEARPPCAICGWRQTVIRVRTVKNWGWSGDANS